MTIGRDEILGELRELIHAIIQVDIARFARTPKHMTPGQWASWDRSVERAKKFLGEVDGPKIETGCNCGSPIFPCKLHGTSEGTKKL